MKGVIVGPLLAAIGTAIFSTGAFSQVTATNAWVRGTVSGQTASGAFMELKSASGAVLLGVESPLAGSAEIHEMKMDGNVMRMRAVSGLDHPPGKNVQLHPGGYHIMLMGLRQPLKKGEIVPIRLKVRLGDKSTKTIEVKAEVRDLTAASHPAH